jgi:hypothetical protein
MADGGGGESGASLDAGMCVPAPQLDADCRDASRPHAYACLFPRKPPSDCVLLNVGNATDLYCCP